MCSLVFSEIDVQNQLFEGVHLHVTQQDFVFLASEFHVKHGSVESFFLDGMPQRVVINFDQRGFSGTTVNDAGGTAGNAETAARTRALLGALKSDKFHNLLQ
jgi:hypothetical protein